MVELNNIYVYDKIKGKEISEKYNINILDITNRLK